MWICIKNKKHKPFPQRISTRAAEHAGCPKCADEDLRTRTTKKANVANQKQRSRAAKQRPVTILPVLDPSVLKTPRIVGEPTLRPKEASVLLGRLDQTIRNWIRSVRIRAPSP